MPLIPPSRLLCFLGLSLGVLLLPSQGRAAPSQIAVWNPEKGTDQPPNRFVLDPAYLDRVAGWLQAAGLPVVRLTSQALNDPAAFSAGRTAALVLPGDSFPRVNLDALKRFSDEGGILVALDGRTPFVVAIAQKADGSWTMSPERPYMKWQSAELLGHLGLRYIYDPARQDQAALVTPAPLFRTYLPSAPERIDRPFAGMWIVPEPGAHVYPLLRSQRVDGADVPPQIFIVERESRRAIVCLNGLFTSEKEPKIWPLGAETVVALAKIARDLRAGRIDLGKAAEVSIPADLAASEPMRNRRPAGSVDLNAGLVVQRWGKFDGGSFELGEPVPPGRRLVLAAGDRLPRMLAPGASVELPVTTPDGSAPLFLRIRGGYLRGGAGLRVESGGRVFWDETFVQVDATGAGNFAAKIEGELPTELQRVTFVAPDGPLLVSNPGAEPFYFDAIQLECAAPDGDPVFIGPMQTDLSANTAKVPPTLTREWNLVRCNIRTNLVGPPGDPERFAATDKLFAGFLRTGARIQLLLEGTPGWAAVSGERYAAGEKIRRGRAVPPDTAQYEQLVRDIIARYGRHVFAYEIWNEPDVGQFWSGTTEEYAAFLVRIAGVIRKLAPGAPLISAGMASYHEDFINKLHERGAFQAVDWIGFHPYAGTGSGWDVAFGRLEGKLLSLGIDKPVYCDESGFVFRPGEWFKGSYNVEVQRDLLEKAMGRLLADSTSRLNVFHATGSDHPFDLIDPEGRPRPAYAVLADYMRLGRNDGHRLETGLTAGDGGPVRGIYRMAARHADGSVTVVLNPGDAPGLQRIYDPSTEFDRSDGWTTFFGKSAWADGRVVVTPAADRDYAGFFTQVSTSADLRPILEIGVPECAGSWDLVMKFSDKTAVTLARKQKAGVFRINYRELIKRSGFDNAELSFRIHGGPATFDYVHFLMKDGDHPAPVTPVPVRLLVPWTGPAVARAGETTLPVKPETAGKSSWVEITVPLTERTVLTLTH